MGEGGAVLTNATELKTIVESFRDWGRDCWCEPGKDNTCGKRFGWQLGELPVRLRPQVHLQPHRLQPEGSPTCRPRSAWRSSTSCDDFIAARQDELSRPPRGARADSTEFRPAGARRRTASRAGSASRSRSAPEAGFTR